MLINSVTLQNFKSYKQAQIQFQSGVNAIIGPNGAGKSSILEAIGFVLFNCRGSGYERRLHEGTNRGQVVISLTSSLDEREYDVERVFSDNATVRYRVIDPQINQSVAEGVDDVRTWIGKHLRVEPGADLPTLFENTIGVPQGTFTAPFLLTAAQRKGVFDPLLQVDEYQRASDKLLHTGRVLARCVTDLKVDVARLQGLLVELPLRQAEEQAINLEIITLQQRTGRVSNQVQILAHQLEELDRAEALVRQSENAHQNARIKLTGLEEQLKSAEKVAEEAAQAQKECKTTQSEHEEFVRREAESRLLNTQRNERDTLVQQLNRWSTDQEKQAVRENQLEDDLAAIRSAITRLTELEPQVAQQQSLESELRLVESQCQKLDFMKRQLMAATGELAEAKAQEDKIAESLALAIKVEAQVNATQAAIQQAQLALTAIVESRARKAADIIRLQTHTRVLSEATTARCPVCDLELTPAHRAELLQRNQIELNGLQQQTIQLDADHLTKTRSLQTNTAALKNQQAQLRNLPSPQDYTRAQANSSQRCENQRIIQNEVLELEPAPERRKILLAQLIVVGDPRRSYQLHEAQAKRKDAVMAELQQVLLLQSQTTNEIDRLEAALGRYSNLDDDLRANQVALDKLRAAHQRFLANEKTAAEYVPRRKQVERLTNEVTDAQSSAESFMQALASAQLAYDTADHQRIRGEWLTARNDLAATRAQLELKSERRTEVRRAIADLQTNQQVLEQKRAELVEYTRAQVTLDLIRLWLKEAGPQVTRQLVTRISREASNIYSDIMDDHTGWLSWSSDYEVELEIKGARRGFRQLSGGEQMTAALALRLALLRLTSAIDIAFFDEPTAHLDPERRENLAEKITQVKGFSQIFVISHDDTFERTAQSYIRIIKDEHGSHWEGRQ